MPRSKITQFIFDNAKKVDLDRKWGRQTPATYGYLYLTYSVYKAITERRDKLRMTQLDLAKKSGIAQPTIARIEAGRANPSIKQLVKIFHALKVALKLEPMSDDDIKYFEKFDLNETGK